MRWEWLKFPTPSGRCGSGEKWLDCGDRLKEEGTTFPGRLAVSAMLTWGFLGWAPGRRELPFVTSAGTVGWPVGQGEDWMFWECQVEEPVRHLHRDVGWSLGVWVWVTEVEEGFGDRNLGVTSNLLGMVFKMGGQGETTDAQFIEWQAKGWRCASYWDNPEESGRGGWEGRLEGRVERRKTSTIKGGEGVSRKKEWPSMSESTGHSGQVRTEHQTLDSVVWLPSWSCQDQVW